MIRILLFLPICAFAANNKIPTSKNGVTSQLQFKVIKKHNDFQYSFQSNFSHLEVSRKQHEYSLASSYKVHPNLKIETSYQRSYGLRHEEDWKNINNEGWRWHDSSNRGENIFGLKVSPRFLLNKKTRADLNIQYTYNDYNFHKTIIASPSIARFFTNDTLPKFSIYLKSYIYIPINYSEASLYKIKTYIGINYHIERKHLIGLNLGYLQEKWTNHDGNRSRVSQNYESKFKQFLIGIKYTLIIF